VGAYGRQLGRIGDALQAPLDHTDLGALTKSERRAIDRLKLQLQQVEMIEGG
jgi:hypothetical protein